jgi:hypothetical protein
MNTLISFYTHMPISRWEPYTPRLHVLPNKTLNLAYASNLLLIQKENQTICEGIDKVDEVGNP